jgi:hypothetical protein
MLRNGKLFPNHRRYIEDESELCPNDITKLTAGSQPIANPISSS